MERQLISKIGYAALIAVRAPSCNFGIFVPAPAGPGRRNDVPETPEERCPRCGSINPKERLDTKRPEYDGMPCRHWWHDAPPQPAPINMAIVEAGDTRHGGYGHICSEACDVWQPACSECGNTPWSKCPQHAEDARPGCEQFAEPNAAFERPSSTTCPACGFQNYTGAGHPRGGKRTQPKTRWCVGEVQPAPIETAGVECSDHPVTGAGAASSESKHGLSRQPSESPAKARPGDSQLKTEFCKHPSSFRLDANGHMTCAACGESQAQPPPTRPGDSPLTEGHGTGRVSGAKAQGFEAALNDLSLLLHSGIPHAGNLHDPGNCVCCAAEDAVRAEHAAEVEYVRTIAGTRIESYGRGRAAGVAEGRRQMAREVLEKHLADEWDTIELHEWLESQSREEAGRG